MGFYIIFTYKKLTNICCFIFRRCNNLLFILNIIKFILSIWIWIIFYIYIMKYRFKSQSINKYKLVPIHSYFYQLSFLLVCYIAKINRITIIIFDITFYVISFFFFDTFVLLLDKIFYTFSYYLLFITCSNSSSCACALLLVIK